MKFSIITPSLNQGKYIESCIESVRNQNFGNVEHIIIDACSTDETHSVLKRYDHLKIIIEKDSGPASAINKGLRMATGDVVAWLNADDYYERDIFGLLNETFEKDRKTDFVYGNLTFVNESGNVILKDITRAFDFYSLINVTPDIRQPSSFFKKDLVMRVNYLNENLKIVFDYDLFIRLSKITCPVYVNKNLCYYRDHSETITRKNVRKQALEIFKVAQSHGGRLFTPVSKLVLVRLLKGVL